jgi:hypothetical protein
LKLILYAVEEHLFYIRHLINIDFKKVFKNIHSIHKKHFIFGC